MYRVFSNCDYIEGSDYFIISGRIYHWTALLFPMSWIYFGLPALLDGYFLNSIISLIIIIVVSIVLFFSYNFKIHIDKRMVLITHSFLFFRFLTIRSKLEDLIIDHPDANGLSSISFRKDYHNDDMKNNLRFSYLMPLDSDQEYFYINYKNKEVDFDIGCDDFVWNNLMRGLSRLEEMDTKP